MARVIGDVCFPAGKYVKDGEEKTRWMKVGVEIETDKGRRIKLDTIPVVNSDNGLWLSVFEKDDHDKGYQKKPAQNPSQAPQQGNLEDTDENMPF